MSFPINLTAVVQSSTSIHLHWTLKVLSAESSSTLSGFMVFYKVFDDTPSFDQLALPPTTTSLLLENLKKFTHYQVLVSPSSSNGTGIPSELLYRQTFEDGKLCKTL